MIHKRLFNSLSLLTLFVLCGSLLLVLRQAALLYTAYSGHDQAWYLIAARRVLEGAQLYGPYVSDTNPPMIVWFSALPILLSRVLPLSGTVSLRLLVLLLLLASTGWCLRVLRNVSWMTQPFFRSLVGFCILYVTLRIAPVDFGQREHLFVIFALPYLFAAGGNVFERLSLPERCALGLAAGLAICFKPQDALVLLAAETVLLIERRSLRRLISPEAVTLAVSCGVYFLALRMLTPLYIKQVIPLLVDTYWAYGTSSVLELLLAMKVRLLIAVTLLVACAFSLRTHSSFWMVMLFAACSVGASFACAIQRTDWPYHRYPVWAFSNLAIAGFLLNISQPLLQRLDSHRVSKPVGIACLAIVFLAGLRFFPRQMAALRPQRSEVYRYLAEQKEPHTVLVFSTTVGWMADILDLKWNWGGRSPCLWFLPAIVQNEQAPVRADTLFKHLSPEKLATISSIQRTEIVEDMNHFQPSLIMVEHCDRKHSCQAIEGKDFDAISWFLQDQQFVEAWSHYKRQSKGPANFDVYARTP